MFSLVFPGQGSQLVGMGKEFYDSFHEARMLLEHAEDCIKVNIKKLMFDGPIEELTKTENAQFAIFTCSHMILRMLENEGIYSDILTVAGHSLGEYTALSVAGVFNFETGIKIAKKRGEIMKKFSNDGYMAAILGLDIKTVESLLDKDSFIANDNCPKQVVVSGKKDSIDETLKNAVANSAKIVKLNVSGPFHSPMMMMAAKELKNYLNDIEFNEPGIPIYMNVTAEPSLNPEEIKQLLISQMTNRVRWRETIINISEKAPSIFLEIGSGNVLTNLIKRTCKEVNVCNINTVKDIEKVLKIKNASF